MLRSLRFGVMACAVVWTLAAAPGLAQDVDARIRALEEANRKLAEQNQTILDRLSRAEMKNAELETRLSATGPDADANKLEDLIANMGDAARGDIATWPALTRSANPIRFFGRVRLDAYYNTARMNRAVNPMWVIPENDINAEDDDDAFAFDARLTSIGMDVDAGRIGSADVGGRIEFDFANFSNETSEARAYPRLLVGYVDIDFGNLSLRFGQDWDVIAPYDPLVDEQSHLWNTGNLGDRRPMAEVLWNGGDDAGFGWEVNGAAGLTGAINNEDLDAFSGQFLTTERDGFDAGHPHGQLEVAVLFPGWVPGKRIRLGAFGLWGTFETDAEFGNEDRFTIWAAGMDLFVPLLSTLSLKGEFFIGQALSDFRGGIAQTIELVSGDEVESKGGWAELFWEPNDFFGIGVGAAIDNPNREDLVDGDRASNWTIYLATRFDWGGGLTTGFDVLFWKTNYINRDEGDTLRFDMFVELRF